MSFTFTMPAPEGSRFEPGAFDAQVGKVVPLRFESFMGVEEQSGLITAVTVAPNGLSAEVTIEPQGVIRWSRTPEHAVCGRPWSEHTGDDCPPPM